MGMARDLEGAADAQADQGGSSGKLQTLLLDLELGQLAVAGICGGEYLLCAYADPQLQAGMLKVRNADLAASPASLPALPALPCCAHRSQAMMAFLTQTKVEALATYLEESLSQLSTRRSADNEE